MEAFYFFSYFLVPRYLFTRKFLQFGLYSFYMFVVSLTLELIASVTSMLMMIQFGINETGPLVTDVFLMGIILHFVVLFMAFILLIRRYFIDQSAIVQLEEEKSKFEKGFITVRSVIVNKDKVTSFNREEMLLGEIELPVSRSYRNTVRSLFK